MGYCNIRYCNIGYLRCRALQYRVLQYRVPQVYRVLQMERVTAGMLHTGHTILATYIVPYMQTRSRKDYCNTSQSK